MNKKIIFCFLVLGAFSAVDASEFAKKSAPYTYLSIMDNELYRACHLNYIHTVPWLSACDLLERNYQELDIIGGGNAPWIREEVVDRKTGLVVPINDPLDRYFDHKIFENAVKKTVYDILAYKTDDIKEKSLGLAVIHGAALHKGYKDRKKAEIKILKEQQERISKGNLS